MPSESNRFARQEDLVPRDRLADIRATVIGVGAIGRNVVLQLAAIGVPRIQLVDFDVVDATNVTTQGYAGRRGHDQGPRHADGHPPARSGRPGRGHRRPLPADGGDRAGRLLLCGQHRGPLGHLALGPTALPILVRRPDAGRGHPRVLAVADDQAAITTPPRFSPNPRPKPGRCTARSTIYAASIAAGLMVHQFTRWLRGIPVDRDTSLNLLAGELVVS